MSVTQKLLDNMRVALPGATDGMIQLELFNAVDELCRTAEIYRQVIEIPISEGDTDYDVLPDNHRVVRIYSAAHDTYDPTLFRFDVLDEVLALQEPPTAEHAATPIYLECSLSPRPTTAYADWLPVIIMERHFQAILSGGLARMMAQTAKPYSNQRLSDFHYRRYRNLMGLSRHDTTVYGTPQGQAWSFPRFGR